MIDPERCRREYIPALRVWSYRRTISVGEGHDPPANVRRPPIFVQPYRTFLAPSLRELARPLGETEGVSPRSGSELPQSAGADSPLNKEAAGAADAATLRTVQEAGPYIRSTDIGVVPYG